MKKAISVFSTLILFMASLPSYGAMKDQIKFGNWSGGAFFKDDDNSFLSCSVGASFLNGTFFNIMLNGAGSTTISFVSPAWTLKVGSEISGNIKIDDRYFSGFKGVAVNPTTAMINFLPEDPIFEALRKGKLLNITSEVGSAVYDLTDTAKALNMVRGCSQKYRSLTRVNVEAARWFSKNPWFNAPQYQAQKSAALTINQQLIAEGLDSNSPKFYEELDRRLQKAGINLSVAKPSSPTATPPDPKAASQEVVISGSGFVVSSDNKILTNHHVVESCVAPIVITGPNGDNYESKVLAFDAQNDLALLGSDYKSSTYATFRSDPVKVGEGVIVAGHPFGSSDLVVTNGIVSSLSGLENTTLLTISAPVNHGNSGGALLDSAANVSGIVVARHPAADAQNTNYAIKLSLVKDFLDRQYLTYRTSNSSQKLPTTEVASKARAFSILIRCKALPDTK